MKKIIGSLLIAGTIVSSAFILKGIDPLPLGAKLPKAELQMKDVSGKMVSLESLKTKQGLLIMFSCNTCPYVIKNQARTIAIGNYAQSKGLGFVVLNSNEAYRSGEDSYEEMKNYAKDQGYKWSYLVDQHHEVADAFGANRTPECFLFDKDLKLAYHGAIDDNPSNESAVTREHLKMAINELTSGKEISVKESRSVGCTIKRKA